MRQNLFNKRMEMKKLLFFFLITFLSLAAYAQPNIVRGKVFEAGTKNPIPGANVIVKGTTPMETLHSIKFHRVMC